MSESRTTSAPHTIFITYHLPIDDEPGAFRPWVEARLLREAGHRVTVITSAVHYMTGKFVGPGRGWCREEVRDSIRILRVWTVADYRTSFYRRVLNYAIFVLLSVVAALVRVREHVDWVFAATDPVLVTPLVLLVSTLKRAPVVLDERDLSPDTAIALGIMRPGLATRLVFGMQQFLRRHAFAVLAATPGIKRRLAAYGHSPDQIHVLLNGDPYLEAKQSADPPATVREYRSRFRCLVAYAGTLGQANDVEVIIRAAARLKERDDIGFLIAGTGERLNEYRELASAMGIRNLAFLGAMSRDDSRATLAACDLCVSALPADPFFQGTLPSKLFDYLGSGMPVVFGGEGDSAELLEESGAGIVVPALDDRRMSEALARLADDDSMRKQMSQSGRDWYVRHINVASCGQILRRAFLAQHL